MSANVSDQAHRISLAILAAVARDDFAGADDLTGELDTDELRAMVVAAWTAYINEAARHAPFTKADLARQAADMIAERIIGGG